MNMGHFVNTSNIVNMGQLCERWGTLLMYVISMRIVKVSLILSLNTYFADQITYRLNPSFFRLFRKKLGFKGPLSHFFLIFILIVLCETSSMIPISVCSASRWGSYEGAKLQKRPIMRGRFRCSGPNNAKTS